MNGLLKTIAARLIYNLVAARSEKDILKQIVEQSTISFDVFDTAVKRDVLLPTDVFALVENRLRRDSDLVIEEFSKLRTDAERTARRLNQGREITLADIYDQIPLTEEQRQQLIQMECEVEVEISTPNIPIKRIYDICVQQGKKVLFISDMYLPAEIIGKILRKSGYDPGCLYVSCEAMGSKRDGRLFAHVRELERLEADDWVHVGDSISSDYISPRRFGIKSVLIEHAPRCNEYAYKHLYRKNQNYRRLNHFIDIRLSRYTDPYERIGYAVLGPLLYGFSCWLEREVTHDRTIVFLAREGELLQRAFQIVSDRHSVYLHISRHAANLAYIDHIQDPETVLRDGIRTVKEFSTQTAWAKSFGLSDEETQKALSWNSLDGDVTLSEMTRPLLTAIWPMTKRNASGQYATLNQYLIQLGLTNKCTVVDVGWRGSMQTMLNACQFIISGKICRWSGCYMGCFPGKETSAYAKIERKGFLFEDGCNTWLCDGIRNSAPFFETLFLATEGTTKGYQKDDAGIVYPIFGDQENSEETSAMIRALQNAGVQFVQDLYRSASKEMLAMTAEVSAGNYQAMARVPSNATLSLFNQFQASDEHTFRFGSERSLGYYMFHPKQFIRDFQKQPGKSWFLKSVFKIPLPYIPMLNLARKIVFGNGLREDRKRTI